MKRHGFRCSVSLIGLAVMAAAVQAQDVETVTVTGVRASVQGALDIKQNATQAIDSIVAEDIGKLPDTTVVEALQHVTGVAIVRDNYEVSTVLIRGLPDNQTLLNGRQIFTSTGRAISLPNFPAEMLARVDVHKASSATDISGGVAGLIDVHLRRPFDFDGFTLAGGAALSYPTLAARLDPSASLLISDRWQTGIGEIGLLANIFWRNDHNREDAMNPRGSSWRTGLTSGPVVGSTVPSVVDDPGAINPPCPNLVGTNCPLANVAATTPIRRNAQGNYAARFGGNAYIAAGLVERASASVAAQWRPSDTIEVFAEGFYTRSRNNVASDVFVGQTMNCNDPTRSSVYPGTFFTDTLTYGCFSSTSSQPARTKEDTAQFAAGALWDVTNRLKLSTEWSATVSQTKSTSAVLDIMYNMAPGQVIYNVNSYNGSGGTLIQPNSTAHQNPNNFYFNQFGDNWNDATGGAWDGRVDATYSFGEDKWLKSVEIGYRYNYRNANNQGPSGGSVVCSTATRGTASSGNNLYLVAAYDSPACTAFRNAASVDGVSGNSVRAAGGTTAQINAAINTAMTRIGSPAGQAGFLQIGGMRLTDVSPDMVRPTRGSLFGGDYGLDWWITPNEKFLREQTEVVRNLYGYSGRREANPATAYIVAEGNHDVYWKANYGFEAWGFPVDGNFGVRYVTTRLKQVGADSVYTPNAALGNACLTCIQYIPNTAVKTSHDLLPSWNARITLDDGLFLRLAASKTITRPTFTQTNPAQRVITATSNVQGSITAGNSNLTPIKAVNLDIDLSYYWGQGNHVTIAGFNRDVSGYIQTQTTQVFIDGLAYNRNIPVNLTNAKLRGVEAGYSQFLDFLPDFLANFGWDINATYIDGKFQNIRTWQVNTAGIYESGPFSARVSWTWGSKYIEGTSPGPQPNDLYVAPRANLDASVNYDITDQITIGLDATNIVNSRYRVFGHYAGGDLQTNMNIFANAMRQWDRTIALTARFRY